MVMVSTMRKTGRRRPRTPQHRFNVRFKPWQIQPMFIAPVLPGETMQNLLLQSRVVSDPVANPLIGWWCEHYFFYVKLRDLAYGQNSVVDNAALLGHIEQMLIDPSYVITTDHNTAGASTPLYRYANTIDWQGLCLKRVVEEYFRDEGEDATADAQLAGMPAAKIMQDNVFNSLLNAADYAPVDVSLNTGEESGAGDPHTHALSMKELNEALQRYQWERLNNLTQMTFDEYVATHGVRVNTEERHAPELIRYSREWTYPTNTVEPTTGSPSSALSWSITERADKRRYFTEPGFLFGCIIARPKVYLSKQAGAAVGLLNKATTWLPALLADDPAVSLTPVENGEGPLPSITDADGYIIDVRDLFLHGDQFSNIDLTAIGAGGIALPADSGEHKYPTEAMADALFKWQGQMECGPAQDEACPTLELVRADGVVSINVSGVQEDHTARTSVLA